ncbi:ORFL225C, partial [Human betaherpesvirus 5]
THTKRRQRLSRGRETLQHVVST